MATVAGTVAESGTPAPPRRPRGPGYAFLGLALALLVLIAAVALSTRQAPPPSIAEFAPQAVERISDTDDDGASQLGAGRPDEAATALAEPPPSTDAAIDVPRVRRCVADPPRQIEDPHSPPCVPYWTGDNGGATYKGVTRNEIRIVVPSDTGTAGSRAAPTDTISPLLETFFNSRFEFYGRKLNLIDTYSGDGSAPGQRARALAADQEHHAFGSLEYQADGLIYGEAVARRGLIQSTTGPQYAQDVLAKLRPHLWQYSMGADGLLANTGQWWCARMSGRPAEFAGDPTMRSRPRKLGIYISHDPDNTRQVEPIERELRACGDTLGYVHRASSDSSGAGSATAMVRMREAGVTTLTYISGGLGAVTVTQSAVNQGYQPEWLATTFGNNDYVATIKGFWDPRARASLLGLSVLPRQLGPADTPAWWALQEVRPGWGTSADAQASTAAFWVNLTYRSLLLMASGIQMAGPNLTPATFERGLQAARFPNPNHPIRAGTVGFGGSDVRSDADDHSFTNDAAEMWWSESARGPYSDSTGTWCYVDGGARRSFGSWQREGRPYFTGICT